jgi:hypothetical protein
MKSMIKKTVKPVKKMKEGGAKKCPPGYCPAGGAGAGGGCVYCGGAKWAGRILSAGFTALGNKVFKDASKKSAEKAAAKKAEEAAQNTPAAKFTKGLENKLKTQKRGGVVKSKKK